MSWTLDIPYRSLDDELIDVASAAGSLPDPEARAVLKELLVEAAGTGIKTAGDLFDRLARITPAERRVCSTPCASARAWSPRATSRRVRGSRP